MALKILKWIGIGIGGIILLIILFILCSILPIDRYDYKEQDFYKTELQQLDSLKRLPIPIRDSGFVVGYAAVSITPDHPTDLAGHSNRRGKLFTSIHDSIYVRALVIENGTQRAAVVSADLLIMPPLVTQQLQNGLPTGFSLDNTFLGATHTHNSIGNWTDGAASLLYGSFDDSTTTFIAAKIKEAIEKASKNARPATIRYTQFPFAGLRNRVNPEGDLDSLVHVIEVERSDKKKLVLMSYTAHPTCISRDDISLSRDYPGFLVDSLEHSGYDFAMFMAGAVGSHAGKAPDTESSCTEWIPNQIIKRFERNNPSLVALHDSTLGMYRIPLPLPDPQVKISRDWKVRSWVFRSALGEYPVYVTALRIGDLIMIGTPCDYSGELTPELYTQGIELNVHVMVTSFNGGYIGYVTPDEYYDVDHYETRLMNWYGPGSGAYLSETVSRLLDVAAR
jgi:neutral ceramidase